MTSLAGNCSLIFKERYFYLSTEWFLSPDSSGSGSFLGNCRRQKRVKHRATKERGGEDFAGDKSVLLRTGTCTVLLVCPGFKSKSIHLSVCLFVCVIFSVLWVSNWHESPVSWI
jgi:hypothetical protein